MSEKITSIEQIVKNVFADLENKKNLSREDVEARWKELIGEAGAKHSKPVTLRKGILCVLVDSSVWMQEASMRKRGLLKGLKRLFGKDRISEIRFKIGDF